MEGLWQYKGSYLTYTSILIPLFEIWGFAGTGRLGDCSQVLLIIEGRTKFNVWKNVYLLVGRHSLVVEKFNTEVGIPHVTSHSSSVQGNFVAGLKFLIDGQPTSGAYSSKG